MSWTRLVPATMAAPAVDYMYTPRLLLGMVGGPPLLLCPLCQHALHGLALVEVCTLDNA